MIPENRLSNPVVFAPYAEAMRTARELTVDYEIAGVALNDGTQGMQVKQWTCEVIKRDHPSIPDAFIWDIELSAPGVPTTIQITSATEITEVAFAFDNNMNNFIAYVEGGVPKFRWYSVGINDFVTVTLPVGTINPRACVDDKRAFNNANSDIILAYIRAGNLYVRYQRENYAIENLMKSGLGPDAILIAVGMNQVKRLQFWVRGFADDSDAQVKINVAPYLGDVILRLLARLNIKPTNINVSECYEDLVHGIGFKEKATVDKLLSQLLEAYIVDPVEFDKVLHFNKRGRTAVVRISWKDLLTGDPTSFKTKRKQELELAKEININHIDPDGGYARNKQSAKRKSNLVKAKGSKTKDFDIAMKADFAATLANVLMQIEWYEMQTCEFELPIEFAYLTPTDVIEYEDKEGNIIRVRLESRNEDGPVLKFEGTQDAGEDVYKSIRSGTALPPPTSTTPGLVGETRVEIINSACFRDQDDEPGVYVAASGANTAWYGYSLLVSSDEGVTYVEALQSEQPATLGDTETALLAEISAEYPARQTVDVKVNFGLESISHTTLMNYFNRCVIGDEIMQFETAVPLGDGVYRLGGLLRGRYNTKVEAHPIGTRFVLLDSALSFVQAQKWMIGLELYFKPVSFGKTEDETIPVSYDFDESMNQVEWPPHNVTAVRDVSNNVQVDFIARPRLGIETSPYHSKYFLGYKVKFSDGFEATLAKDVTTYTRASTPPAVTITVCGLNEITGDGEYSQGVTV